MHRYRKLRAWEHCRALAVAIYSASSRFPSDERFGITAQIRRAAISAVANIAEGSAKAGKNEFARFLDIALGSLAEVDALVDLSTALGYLTDAECVSLSGLREDASQITFALKRRIRS